MLFIAHLKITCTTVRFIVACRALFESVDVQHCIHLFCIVLYCMTIERLAAVA